MYYTIIYYKIFQPFFLYYRKPLCTTMYIYIQPLRNQYVQPFWYKQWKCLERQAFNVPGSTYFKVVSTVIFLSLYVKSITVGQ